MSRAVLVSRIAAATLLGLTAPAATAQAPARPPLVEVHSRKTSEGYEVKVLVHEPSESDGHNEPGRSREREPLPPAVSDRATEAPSTAAPRSHSLSPQPQIDQTFEQLRNLPLTPAQLEQIRQVLLQTQPKPPAPLASPSQATSEPGSWQSAPPRPPAPASLQPRFPFQQDRPHGFVGSEPPTTASSEPTASGASTERERFPIRPAAATFGPGAASVLTGSVPPAPAISPELPSIDDPSTPRTLMPDSVPGAESLLEAWQSALSRDRTLESLRWQTSAAVRSRQAAEAEHWATASLHSAFHANNKPQGILAPPVPGFTSFPDSLNTHQRNSVEFGVHVKQPLYTFGRVRNSINAASMQTSAQRHAELVASQDVMLAVARA